LWLWFWLQEDILHPEPKKMILWTFLAGMAAIGPALVLEWAFGGIFDWLKISSLYSGLLLLFAWAFSEEICKYFAAKKTSLFERECDEPIDDLIYLITAALGFAAAENVMYLISVTKDYGFLAGFATGNLRFIGATLVHFLSSAVVGASVAFSFFHKEKYHRNVILGIIFATLLHAFFNYFIIINAEQNSGQGLLRIFSTFWVLVFVLLFVFEKVKNIKS
jgi:RsiW-degrading membrane proteinase PrsW (M82 family)